MDPQPTVHPLCPSCKAELSELFYFCPNCGKQLRYKPLSTAVGHQIGIYALSFFLPPLGLIPAYKYLHAKDPKVSAIGFAAVFLTAISLATTVYYIMQFMELYKSMLPSIMELKKMQGY